MSKFEKPWRTLAVSHPPNMAPLNTHLVIAERVYPHLLSAPEGALCFTNDDYGYFLMGNLIVDANNFLGLDRRVTHFVGRLSDDGENSFTRSCEIFVSQLDRWLVVPWLHLTSRQQALVVGYLCHLAADEVWKQNAARLFANIDDASAIPFDVLLTVTSVASHPLYHDFPRVLAALGEIEIPDVFTHITQGEMERMWRMIREALPLGATYESFMTLLAGSGHSPSEILKARQRHIRCWDQMLALIEQHGGVTPYIDQAVQHVLVWIRRLYATLSEAEVCRN